jgi:hypothetical protein
MKKKINSWGHTLRPLTEEEVQRQISDGKRIYKNVCHEIAVRYGEQHFINFGRRCRISSKCKNLSVYMLKYYYITGRRGNVSYAEKPICEEHARKYQKTQITMKTQLEAIIQQLNEMDDYQFVEVYNRYCELTDSPEFMIYDNCVKFFDKLQESMSAYEIFDRLIGGFRPEDKFFYMERERSGFFHSTDYPKDAMKYQMEDIAEHILNNQDAYADIFQRKQKTKKVYGIALQYKGRIGYLTTNNDGDFSITEIVDDAIVFETEAMALMILQSLKPIANKHGALAGLFIANFKPKENEDDKKND